MNSEVASLIVNDFARLSWHDSELLGWGVTNANDDDSVVTLDVSFRKSDAVSGRTEIKFHDCRGFFADVDLLAKRLCGDQIASACCELAEESQSPFVKQINDRFDLDAGESLAGLLVFGITLIHPSGQLVVVARSFSLRTEHQIDDR